MPSRHIRCITTASFRATAIFAFFRLLRLAIRTPHARSDVHCRLRVSITWVAVNSRSREGVAGSADASTHIGLTGLVLSTCQAKMGANVG